MIRRDLHRCVGLAWVAVLVGLFEAPAARGFEANTVSNLVLWLAADAGVSTNASGVVTNWTDQSGSGNHAAWLAGNAVLQASYKNGKPGVRFDGTGDALSFTRITNIWTVFWVLHEESGVAVDFRPVLGDSTYYYFHRGENRAIFGSYTPNEVRNGTTYVNGTSVGNGTGTTVPTNAAIIAVKTAGSAQANQLGRDRTVDSRAWNGVIAEVLVYTRTLSSNEMNAVGLYLASKYAIAASYQATNVVKAQVVNGAVSGISLAGATVHGTLVSTGVSATAATLYWGTSDAGTNTAAWACTNGLGQPGEGPLSVTLAGLAEDTLYYYTFVASNAQAVVCATPSRSFRTALDVTRWGYRVKIRFPGYGGAGELTNFPVLVRLGSQVEGFDHGAFLSPPCGDLRFVDTNSISLNYDVEKWDTNGPSHLWVQVPVLRGSNDFIWAYWGLRNASAPVFTTNGATWSEGFGGVWHLSDGATNGGIQRDASPCGNHGTFYNASGSNTAGAADGAVAGADYFSGDNGLLEVPHAASIQPLTALSVEFWAKSATPAWNRYGCLLAKRSAYMIHPNVSTSNQAFHVWVPAENNSGYVSTDIQRWHHYAGTFGDGVIRFFIDGVPVAVNTLPATDYTINPDTGVLCIGRDDYVETPSRALYGWMDEVRISGVARSTNWIRAAWSNQVPGSAFVAYGSVEYVRKVRGVVLMIR